MVVDRNCLSVLVTAYACLSRIPSPRNIDIVTLATAIAHEAFQEKCHSSRHPNLHCSFQKFDPLWSILYFILLIMAVTIPTTHNPPWVLLSLALLQDVEIKWDAQSGEKGHASFNGITGTEAVRAELEKNIPGKEVSPIHLFMAVYIQNIPQTYWRGLSEAGKLELIGRSPYLLYLPSSNLLVLSSMSTPSSTR